MYKNNVVFLLTVADKQGEFKQNENEIKSK